MIRRHGTGLRIAFMVLDAVSAIAITVGVFIAMIGLDPATPRGQVGELGLLLTIYAFVWVRLLGTEGLYRIRARWSIRSEALAVGKAVAILSLGSLVTLFALGLTKLGYVLLIAMPVQAIASIVARASLRTLFRLARRRGRNLRSILIIGTGPTAQAFDRKLAARWDLGLFVEGFIGSPEEGRQLEHRYLGTIDQLPKILHERVIDEVAICLPRATRDEIDELCELCLAEGKTIRIPTELPNQMFSAGHFEDLDGSPVVSLVSGPDKTMALAAKRLIDVAGSAIGLIVLSPLLAAVALVILVVDGRPVLFRQHRAGVHGRTFVLVKFRTMIQDADSQRAELRKFNEVSGSASFKMTNDPRITRIGKFLRRSSIDELPQLWNVLRGEMSLVGPRPHPLDDVAGYDSWHRRRLIMKPGITGLWQIAGRREPDFDRWVSFDLEYIDHWSLWLDMRLLIRTIPAMLRAEGR